MTAAGNDPFQGRRMTRHVIGAVFVAVLALSACQKSAPKSVFERDYETMVERCKGVASKGAQSRCANRPAETTHRQALDALHVLIADQITKSLPPSGTCSIHGASYLICEHTIGGTKSTIYRLDSSPDGSGSQIMSVWSRRSWSRQ